MTSVGFRAYLTGTIIMFFAASLTSCNQRKSSVNSSPVISADSLKRIAESTQLQRLLFQDTIPLDSIQNYVDQGVNLDIPIGFDDTYYLSHWDESSLLYHFWGTTHHDHLELTALQAALFVERENMEEAVMILLKGGADPNIITSDSITCLDRVIQRSMDKHLLDTLMAYGADPSLVNLKYAWNDLKTIERFVKLGANPKTINVNAFLDDFPLNEYTYGSWRRDFNAMLSYDIDPQMTRPEDLCGFYGEFNQYGIDKLIEKGLDLNAPVKGLRGQYWLDWAIARSHNEPFTKYIIQKGANTCSSGKTPYELAVERKVSKKLLDFIEANLGK